MDNCSKKNKKPSYPAMQTMTETTLNIIPFGQSMCKLDTSSLRPDRRASGNSTYNKLAVQWLNEVLCFVSSFVVADSFRLRNRQLLVAANRQVVKK